MSILEKLSNFKGIDLKAAAGTAMAFGKKNAPALASGGSIAMSWAALYLFGKEIRVAQKRIDIREAELNAEVATGEGVLGTMKDQRSLSDKEKALMYLECCWPALALELGSTLLSVWGAKISMDEIAKAYMLAQLYKKDGDDLKKQILNEPKGEEKLKELEHNVELDRNPPEEVLKNADQARGEGRTYFVEKKTGRQWWDDYANVQKRMAELKDTMNEELAREVRSKYGKELASAFYVSDNIYPDDVNIYVAKDFDVVLEQIGAIDRHSRTELGNLFEVRHYLGESGFMDFNEALTPDEHVDPKTGQPVLCYVDLDSWIYGTNELFERNP